MVFIAFLFIVIIYVAVAVSLILYVRRRTKRKMHLWLAIAFFILLPSWDFILGYIVYYPACLFVPKYAIYETAETDGIYYEGDINNYIKDLSDVPGKDRKILLFADRDFQSGFKFVESLVTEFGKNYTERKSITPTLYRCSQFLAESRESTQFAYSCVPAHNIQSRFAVTSKSWKLGLAEIRFVKISDRSNGRIMAEYSEVTRWIHTLPFFSWLNLGLSSAPGVSCPSPSRYYDIQYEVLKVKR